MRNSAWFRYGLPVLVILLATLLSVGLRPYMESRRSTLFILGIIVSAWFGGLRAGLLATLLSVLAIDFFLVKPYETFSVITSDINGTLLFMVLAFLISYLTAKRRQAEESLRQVIQHQSEFLNILAHELRNPLAPIRNAMATLRLAGADERTMDRQREMIERQVNQIARLLDDLLDVSRLGLSKVSLKRERLDIRSIMAQCLEAARGMIMQHGLELYYTQPPSPIWVEADAQRLEQVFGNLLSNACKYTERGGRIKVYVSQEKNPKGEPLAAFHICDTGLGIAPDLLPHIFDLYSQSSHTMGRSRGGLGIGLALVKGLVEGHGGSVDARSEGIGKGSEFIIRLPVSENDGSEGSLL